MTMKRTRYGIARRDGPGEYQLGIWSITRQSNYWLVVATGPGTLGDGSPRRFPTLAAAYTSLTGEPPPGKDRTCPVS